MIFNADLKFEKRTDRFAKLRIHSTFEPYMIPKGVVVKSECCIATRGAHYEIDTDYAKFNNS